MQSLINRGNLLCAGYHVYREGVRSELSRIIPQISDVIAGRIADSVLSEKGLSKCGAGRHYWRTIHARRVTPTVVRRCCEVAVQAQEPSEKDPTKRVHVLERAKDGVAHAQPQCMTSTKTHGRVAAECSTCGLKVLSLVVTCKCLYVLLWCGGL